MKSEASKIPNAPPDNFTPAERTEREFGRLTSKEHLYVSQHISSEPLPEPIMDEPPYFILICTYLNYLILIIIGHIRDFFGQIFYPADFKALTGQNGLAPWYSGFESFYVRRLKMRLDDCFARPICGAPGRFIKCFERITDKVNVNGSYHYTGDVVECLNLSSYNYLGFAQSSGTCTDAALASVEQYGTSACGPREQIGTTSLHVECERVIAEFVGKPSALVFSMGFGTNANLFTSLVNSKCLVISDELNHASIRFGVRMSGASVKVFPHNDMEALEALLRAQISAGQPKSHRPWKKIIVAVEGLYSMEGNLCNLPKLVELREKYRFFLFVDEAHSIGALGPNGKGICDYFGVSPNKIDLLMGTVTKSFGATGGYVAADTAVIDRLRLDIATNVYGESIAPPVLAQIISSLNIIDGKVNPGEGTERLQRIAFNSRYLRLALKRLGFIVYGADDSPVIPVLLFLPAKMPAFSRMMYEHKIAVVVVGYPATPLTSGRVRLCVSAALTKEDLDRVIEAMSEVGDKLFLKFSSGIAGGAKKKGEAPRWALDDVLANTARDCTISMA
ncbi:hypothetical protein BABINDRAFT_173580 [Babjeviella inositovora NRRL Y-12698]|uniref:Aminotransferase class I/classII large domain-containing protein n=1 Tax=Babjeviella inositovora NRRL Y-12698 TaxID=984486 RepID=A0A1E3QYL7_9ASCO|nr:uncharacterized protein BABINDRAFT_173580 [Babjeviella inositovora NRRL Y-12698]ODQ82728.1 hypothetical protein BABINDRAFT_173580 [Babjeviella inositovora NRRL Y-12698]